MGIFDIWSPNPEKKKEAEKPKASPFSIPQNQAPRHSLPGPAAEPAKPNSKTIKEIFSIFSPKEPKEPKKPEAKGSLLDALIPKSERGEIYEPTPEPFERVRRERPSPAFRPSYYSEPHFRGRRQPWTLPSPEELLNRLTEVFNLDEIFARVDFERKNMMAMKLDVGGQSAYPLVAVAPVDDYDVLGSVFGIPRSVIDSYTEVPPEQAVAATDELWNEILWPLIDMTTPAFELLKPDYIPGWFQLGPGIDDPGILELQYREDFGN